MVYSTLRGSYIQQRLKKMNTTATEGKELGPCLWIGVFPLEDILLCDK
jgi:hypothetical protein